MTSNKLAFTKMHGLGNDFVVINNLENQFQLPKNLIIDLANRHTGIGFDQLLVIEHSAQADFFCRIYNADGQEAEQCGNGLRCVALFIREKGLNSQDQFRIETKAGIFPVQFLADQLIKVELGTPIIEEKLLSLSLGNDHQVQTTILSLGNPHAIVKVESINLVSPTLAQAIQSSNYFPHGVNVGFMQIITPYEVALRTFERGVGETFACGSNACAAAVAGILNGWLDQQVKVQYPLGSLTIEWDKTSGKIFITGPATTVFNGIVQQ